MQRDTDVEGVCGGRRRGQGQGGGEGPVSGGLGGGGRGLWDRSFGLNPQNLQEHEAALTLRCTREREAHTPVPPPPPFSHTRRVSGALRPHTCPHFGSEPKHVGQELIPSSGPLTGIFIRLHPVLLQAMT